MLVRHSAIVTGFRMWERVMRILVVLAFLTLTGCQTVEHLAARDDGACKSYGFQFGTDGYAACRMRLQEQRAEINQRQADRMVAAGTAMMAMPTH